MSESTFFRREAPEEERNLSSCDLLRCPGIFETHSAMALPHNDNSTLPGVWRKLRVNVDHFWFRMECTPALGDVYLAFDTSSSFVLSRRTSSS